MAATTQDRNTPVKRIVGNVGDNVPLATGAIIPFGVMVMVAVPSAGAVNASDAVAGAICLGISDTRGDQTQGDTHIQVIKCVAHLANNGSINATHIGQVATVVDNQTVGLAGDTTNDVAAGIIEGITSTGVWVNMTQARVGAI